jgi:hypothetical protein
MATIQRIAAAFTLFGPLCLPLPVDASDAKTNFFPSTYGPPPIIQSSADQQEFTRQLNQIANPSKNALSNIPNPSFSSITFGPQQPSSSTNPFGGWIHQFQQLLFPTPPKPANNDQFGLGSATSTQNGSARSSNLTTSGAGTTEVQPMNSGPPAGWTAGSVCDGVACRLAPVPTSTAQPAGTAPKIDQGLQYYSGPRQPIFVNPNAPAPTLQSLIQGNASSTTSLGPAPNKLTQVTQVSQVAGAAAALFGVTTTNSGIGGPVIITSNMLQLPAQTKPAGANISSVGFAPSQSGVASTTPTTIIHGPGGDTPFGGNVPPRPPGGPGGGTPSGGNVPPPPPSGASAGATAATAPGTIITPAQLQPSTASTMATGAATATGAPSASSASANSGYTFQQTQFGTVEVRHNGQLIGTGTPSYAAAYGYQPQSGQPAASASTSTASAPKVTVVTPAPKATTPELRASTPAIHTPTPTVQTPTVRTPTVTARVPTPTVHVPTPTVHIPTPTIRVPTVTVRVPTVSDARLKRDIVALGELPDGLHLYRYRYLWSSRLYVGVMAQEVLAVAPDAVVRGNDGYLRVDYGRLGLRLTTWDQWISRRSISNR